LGGPGIEPGFFVPGCPQAKEAKVAAKRTFTIRLDPILAAQLRQLALLQERSRGDVIRRLIADAAKVLAPAMPGDQHGD
jgi:hypothetical protein